MICLNMPDKRRANLICLIFSSVTPSTVSKKWPVDNARLEAMFAARSDVEVPVLIAFPQALIICDARLKDSAANRGASAWNVVLPKFSPSVELRTLPKARLVSEVLKLRVPDVDLWPSEKGLPKACKGVGRELVVCVERDDPIACGADNGSVAR
jgi:hypothetical protein